MDNQINSKNNLKKTLGLTLFIIGIISLLLFWLSYRLRISLFVLLQEIKNSYYFPYVNSCTVGKIGGTPLNIHIYCTILFSALILIVFQLMVFSNPLVRKKPIISKAARGKSCWKLSYQPLLQTSFIVFILLISLQTLNHTQVFAKERIIFPGKTLSEKHTFIHSKTYEFAEFCRKTFPGRHRGELITDLDLSKEPFMGQHRQLAYFLYPTIDIRNVCPLRPLDCTVIFFKNEYRAALPADFQIRGSFNPSCSLAVKKDSP